jgi:hypothetical protein
VGRITSANPVAPQKSWVSKREIANQWIPPRCGRWSALAELGATVGAADLAEGIRPVDKPPPLDRRERRVPGHVGNEVLYFDPCDPDYAHQLESHGFQAKEGVDYAAVAS